MRYEAKHRYFKNLAKKSWNFKNMAKTLAMRHQRLMCYYMNSGSSYLEDVVSIGTGMHSLQIQCTYPYEVKVFHSSICP